jgi:CRP-like cAMP-binding protein
MLTPLPGLLFELSKGLLSPLFAAGEVVNLDAHQTLFSAGAVGDGCYRIENGLVKIVVTSPKGEARILAVLGRGAIVGELSLIDGRPRSATVITIQDSVFRFVRREAFSDFCQSEPEVQRQLVRILAARLRETNDALAAATFLSAKGRVARALLELARHVGEPSGDETIIRDRIGQGDLADLAGVARENVSRVMSEWSRRQLISRSAGLLKIKDIAALKSEMEFDP